MMQRIANAITKNHPEVYLIVLLIDERPESHGYGAHRARGGHFVHLRRASHRHVQVAEMVLEKAKRLVEHKMDVVISPGLDHAARSRLQPDGADLRQDLVRRRRLQRPAQAKALLRRGPQHREGREPDHHLHGVG
jgi:hypothetical protein